MVGGDTMLGVKKGGGVDSGGTKTGAVVGERV